MDALWTSQRMRCESFLTLQPHYNLIHRGEYERELEGVAQKYELGVLPYSPLAGGFLTGKYRPGSPPPPDSRGAKSGRVQGYLGSEFCRRVLERVEQVARKKGVSPSQVSLAWLLVRPSVTSPIIGPKNLEQLKDNLASTEVRLSQDEVAELNEASAYSN